MNLTDLWVNLNYICLCSIEGKKHESGLLQNLEDYAISPAGVPMWIYGDPAYPLRQQLMAPFRNVPLTDNMQAFNKSLSSVRVSVEWLFGDVTRSFKFLDFKNNFKIGLSCVGKMYIVSILIRNAITCLYGNQTTKFFNMDPPTIKEFTIEGK